MLKTQQSFGDILLEIRKDKGISRYKLSKLSGVSQRNLYSIEKNQCDPTLSTLVQLAEALQELPGTLIDLYAAHLKHIREQTTRDATCQ